MGNWCYSPTYRGHNPTNRNPLKSHLYTNKLVVFEAHLGNFLSQGARGSASPPTSTAADVAETKKKIQLQHLPFLRRKEVMGI